MPRVTISDADAQGYVRVVAVYPNHPYHDQYTSALRVFKHMVTRKFRNRRATNTTSLKMEQTSSFPPTLAVTCSYVIGRDAPPYATFSIPDWSVPLGAYALYKGGLLPYAVAALVDDYCCEWNIKLRASYALVELVRGDAMLSVTFKIVEPLRAVEWTQTWRQHGRCHRDFGLPAVRKSDGTRMWYVRNTVHRADGEPAFYRPMEHSSHSYYHRGKCTMDIFLDANKEYIRSYRVHKYDRSGCERVDTEVHVIDEEHPSPVPTRDGRVLPTISEFAQFAVTLSHCVFCRPLPSYKRKREVTE